MYQKRVYLYAFTKDRCVVKAQYLKDTDICIRNIVSLAQYMSDNWPEDVEVYAIDDRFGLAGDFFDAVKTQHSDFSKAYEFYDMIVREGIKVK